MRITNVLSCLFSTSLLLCLLSCGTVLKKDRKSVYSEDSDFLKQGRKIEVFKGEQADSLVESVEEKAVAQKKKDSGRQSHKPSKKVKKTRKKVQTEAKNKVVTKKSAPENEIAPKAEEQSKGVSFPFKVGEKVVLSASFFGVEAGKITIGVDTFKVIEGKKVYNFYAIGKTSSIFSMFYKIGNKIESLWDPEIRKPVSLAFDAKETKQKYKSRVYFDWGSRKAEFLEEGWSKKKGDYREKKTWNLTKSGQDIVSSVFYTRTLPLEVGKVYPVTVFEDAKLIEAKVLVDRKEVLKTRAGRFNTIVIKPSFNTKGKFKKDGEISVWLTDDDYRQIVRIESKIKIGTVVAKLHSIQRP